MKDSINKNLKILLVNHLLNPVVGGGTAERTHQLARFLALEGVTSSILTLDIELTKKLLDDLGDVKIFALPCINFRFYIPFISIKKLKKIISNIDVVQLSGHWTILNAFVYLLCRKLNKPYIFCPAGALKPFGRSLLIKKIYDFIVGRKIIKNASFCVAITAQERSEFAKNGIEDKKIVLIPNGVDISNYEINDKNKVINSFRKSNDINSYPYLLFLGRLNSIKGPDILLDAFISISKSLPNYLLVFAGPDDGLKKQLQRQVELSGLLDRVRFIGFVSGEDKTAALSGADLLIIPSRHEAMSIVVLEAGACGCPVLFTNTCGLSEFSNIGAGIQVIPNANEIAEGILQMTRDSNFRKASTKILMDKIRSDFSWSIQANKYISVCYELLSENRQ